MLEIDLRTRLKALVDTRLKALVGTWRGQVTKSDRAFGYRLLAAASIKECADQLAALLAESEPEPCPDGCGADSEAHCWNKSDWANCEAKAKLPLPLGHEFVPHTNGPERDCTLYQKYCALYQKCHYIGGPGLCGQPRSAHEAREAD